MLRPHFVDGLNATQSAQIHGYSRAAFYLIVAAFEAQGMTGLVDGRRGRRGPFKLTPEIIEFIGGVARKYPARSSPNRSSGNLRCACIGVPSNGHGVEPSFLAR